MDTLLGLNPTTLLLWFLYAMLTVLAAVYAVRRWIILNPTPVSAPVCTPGQPYRDEPLVAGKQSAKPDANQRSILETCFFLWAVSTFLGLFGALFALGLWSYDSGDGRREEPQRQETMDNAP